MGTDQQYDVIVIGAGVIGSAIARELSRYDIRLAVLEKDPDVCFETSGRNTGVCHGGFAYDTGSLKARFCVEGNQMMGDLSKELDFPFKRTGKVLVGNTQEEYDRLLEVQAQGVRNGVKGLRMVNEEELHQLVPSVCGKFALYSTQSGILDPFRYTIALAENAHENGAEYYFDHEVTGITRDRENIWHVTTVHGTFRTRWVVNAAGLSCKKISDMLGITGYHVIGSKDDYIILDKTAGELVPMPIYTVPSNTYMGIHVSCTTDGNVLLGPTAEDTDNLSWYGTAQKNLDYLMQEAGKIWPHVNRGDIIRTYSGILPKLVDENGTIQDYKIEIRDDIAPHAVNLVGIESPGLTSAVPIARYAISLMQEREQFPENPHFNPVHKSILHFASCTEEEQEKLIESNPDYGELICRCEKVPKAEVLQAIHNPLGCCTMASIKYRTRCMMGRCQGGYCSMKIEQLLEQELHKKPEEICLERQGSNILFGRVRDGETTDRSCGCEAK